MSLSVRRSTFPFLHSEDEFLEVLFLWVSEHLYFLNLWHIFRTQKSTCCVIPCMWSSRAGKTNLSNEKEEKEERRGGRGSGGEKKESDCIWGMGLTGAGGWGSEWQCPASCYGPGLHRAAVLKVNLLATSVLCILLQVNWFFCKL